MSATPDSAAPDPSRLRKPLARLLRPLVRLLIRSGLTFPTFCELMRELYVNVAEHDFALPDKVQTDSRVSLLTGIHRKEVSRLRGAGAPLMVAPVALSRTSRIMAVWLGGPPFSDRAGHPLPLPRTAVDAPCFDALVAGVTRDVRPRAVLDEWLDRGLVSLDDAGRVVLRQTAHIPAPGDEQQLYYFGRNLHDHIAGAVANVLGERPSMFERSVHYGGLPEAVARQLEAHARTLASTALQAANVEANGACDGQPAGPWRWNFGTYVYVAEDSRTATAEPLSGRDP